MKPAVFLDRDGVINVDHGYVSKIDDFEFIEGVFEACKAFKAMGYKVVVITNQSGIARGMYTEDTFQELTQWMDWNFDDKGVLLDGVYYCPHHAEKGLGQYKVDCSCRKPKPGMLLEAQKDLDIDLAASVFVGDKADDMRAARAAGVGKAVLVETGKTVTSEAKELADVVLASIAEVPDWLESNK
ncbi:D-glycero-beta-D-manno-heptose 1,7-bisphosphate 7-phosphatase [Gallaecimonas kandeliae]|uniref:D-glycero-beta-D-manno-heptose 1,7-bisphosphate 7-phosphatase n=1 Tax=Gallaecimonas kandeliae TaxID=3029055 RepID=UPI002647DB01|nr:D-glycero-beta-D-manno-heptose 1,7-bisphosphate 7-phosphatase [Gallaecimonas kandeliae]WKE66801.1 D-glycero-beta-D-manno-heptose 1,7-bisphosphate 7-phosphatase [Gallaecimonas kandeliae]